MTRNQHDLVNDHFGVLDQAQMADGTPTSGYAPVSNGDGTTTWGPAGGGSSVNLVDDNTTYSNDGIRFTSLATYLGAEEGTAVGPDSALIIDTAGDFMELYSQNDASIYCIIDFNPTVPNVDIYASDGSGNVQMTLDGATGLIDMHLTGNAFLPPMRSSAPSSPAEGWTYYNTTTHKLMVYDGTTWQACW